MKTESRLSNSGELCYAHKIIVEPQTEYSFPKKKISCSTDAYDYVMKFYKSDILAYESAFALYLNQGGMTIGFAKISQGGITGTVMDIKMIVKYAIDLFAQSIIIVHNHPSGNLTPSQQDIIITRKINNAAETLELKLLDHLILTDKGYISLKDENKF